MPIAGATVQSVSEILSGVRGDAWRGRDQVPRPLPSPAVSRRGPGGMALSGQEAEKQGPAEPRPGREPESWWCLVSYLCFYGFMAQMRPGESFITPYLLGPDKNFTQKQARGRRAGRGACRLQVLGLHASPMVTFTPGRLEQRQVQQRSPLMSLGGCVQGTGGSGVWAELSRGRCPERQGGVTSLRATQVTNEITPVLSYSYLAVLVPVFLLTDYLRYKPVLLLQGLSYVSVWLLLLFGSSVLHMQLMELFFSVTMAARIAYSSYVFSLVPPAHYQRVAGYSRAAVLLGVFTSSVLGQLLVTVGRVPFSTLNYVSLAFLTFSLVLALFLRRPKRSLFFNAARAPGASPSELDQMNPGPGQPTGGRPGPAAAWRDLALARVLRELGHNLRLPQLRLWSLWWVFNSTGYYLIVYYVHILWNVVNPTMDSTRVYNGGADAASTLLGTPTRPARPAAPEAGRDALVSPHRTDSIWLCYMAFVLFRGSYQFLVPIATPTSGLEEHHLKPRVGGVAFCLCRRDLVRLRLPGSRPCPSLGWTPDHGLLFLFSFQIASSLSQELRALVFGVNTFLATVLKTIITLIVSDKRGLGLPVHSQFLVYFMYFLVLFVAYFFAALLVGLQHLRRGIHQPLPPAQELRSPVQEKAVQDGALGSLQPGAWPLALEDGVEAVGPASPEQSQQPEAKA
ncbi:Folate transporter 1 [Camelus dromedarius]|uniref:Folate transporter 1 n=1 Tax=Camelus dromedarius TaxID=9838 RepID=A0A5N4EJI4_CAMDR|nr:Folate transporter 1 [Camelus dromedarius]